MRFITLSHHVPSCRRVQYIGTGYLFQIPPHDTSQALGAPNVSVAQKKKNMHASKLSCIGAVYTREGIRMRIMGWEMVRWVEEIGWEAGMVNIGRLKITWVGGGGVHWSYTHVKDDGSEIKVVRVVDGDDTDNRWTNLGMMSMDDGRIMRGNGFEDSVGMKIRKCGEVNSWDEAWERWQWITCMDCMRVRGYKIGD